MDVRIENNDISINSNNEAVMIEGIDRIVQQIKIALSAKKGSFVYDRNMGAGLTEENLLAENGAKTLQTVIYEILINEPDVEVEVKEIEKRQDKIYGKIIVKDKYETRETEVIAFE